MTTERALLATALWALAQGQPPATVLCVQDATTHAPLVGATVRDGAPPRDRVWVAACERVRPGAVRIARAGYRTRTLEVAAQSDTQLVDLTAQAAQSLALQRVVANATREVPNATLTARDARERGAATVTGVIGLLPYTQLRSARGETGLSLRGARREQVVITLDGLPLNDPATGLADVSDVPLASLGSATVSPGADPLNAGSGASGGVLALTTQAQQLLSVRAGAFGAVQTEAAAAGTHGALRVNGALSWRTARNDFGFLNDAGVSPVRETRVNNDERRLAASGGVLYRHTQLALLASHGERGMVGAANVRTYDADRARTDRAVARVQQTIGTTVASLGVRGFALDYRDPTRPALDTRATAWASDADWRGAASLPALGPGTWRVGVGADGLTASGNLSQRRSRGFAAYSLQRAVTARGEAELGVRADVIERHGVQPVGASTMRWRVATPRGARLDLVARAAQAVRVPTLYDLYFSSPQRLFVKTLAPERVRLDASVGLTASTATARASATAEVLLVSRTTRDAIVWFPGNFGWSPANVGRETLRGVESRAGLSMGAVRISSWLTVYEAMLLSNGLRIPTPYVPRVASGSQLQVTHRAWSLSTNARYQGRRPYTAGPRNPDFELPDVWLVDGAVSHHRLVHRTDVLVTLTLDNATDAHWQSVRGFPMPGRSGSLGITLVPARHP